MVAFTKKIRQPFLPCGEACKMVAVVVSCAIVLTLIAYNRVFLLPGVLAHKDINYPRNVEQYLVSNLYVYNYQFDTFNFFLAKIPIVVIIYLLSQVLPYFLVMKLYIAFPLFLSMVCMSLVIFGTLCHGERKYTLGAVLVGGILYAVNPFSIHMLHNSTHLSYAYALLPVTYWAYQRLLETSLEKKGKFIKYVLWFSVSSVVQSLQIHSLLLYAMPVIILTFLVCLFQEHLSLRMLLLKNFIAAMVSLSFNFYWILPLLASSLATNLEVPWYDSSLQQFEHHLMNVSSINILNLQHTPFLDDSIVWELPSNAVFRLWLAAGVLIVFLAFLGVYATYGKATRYRRSQVLTVLLIFVMGYFLVWVGVSPIGESYLDLMVGLPIGFLFRAPHRFDAVIALALSFLTAWSVFSLLEKVGTPFLRSVLLCSWIVLILFHAWPIFTGDFSGRFTPHNTSIYDNVLDWIQNNPPNGAIIWLPNQFWELDIYNYPIRSLEADVFSGYPISQRSYLQGLFEPTFLDKNDISDDLARIGVSYIVVDIHVRNEYVEQRSREIVNELENQTNLDLVYEENQIYIFSNQKESSIVYVDDQDGSRIGIESLRRINPIRWEATITSKSGEPFSLVLAEYYSPLWVARTDQATYASGIVQIVEQVSFPYFEINEAGKFQVTIINRGQFYLLIGGLVTSLSVATILIIFVGLRGFEG